MPSRSEVRSSVVILAVLISASEIDCDADQGCARTGKLDSNGGGVHSDARHGTRRSEKWEKTFAAEPLRSGVTNLTSIGTRRRRAAPVCIRNWPVEVCRVLNWTSNIGSLSTGLLSFRHRIHALRIPTFRAFTYRRLSSTMEEQLTKLVDTVWEKHLQTPPDRRLRECLSLFASYV